MPRLDPFTKMVNIFVLESPRFDTPHTHGTGCTFSACLTAELAKGAPLKSAVKTAKDFITAAISHPLNIGQDMDRLIIGLTVAFKD